MNHLITFLLFNFLKKLTQMILIIYNYNLMIKSIKIIFYKIIKKM